MAKYNAETHARNVRAAIAAGTVTDFGHLYNDDTCTCRACAERFADAPPEAQDVAALADLMLAVAQADAQLRARDPGAFVTREQAECLVDPARYEEALALVDGWEMTRAISAGTRGDLAAAIVARASY